MQQAFHFYWHACNASAFAPPLLGIVLLRKLESIMFRAPKGGSAWLGIWAAHERAGAARVVPNVPIPVSVHSHGFQGSMYCTAYFSRRYRTLLGLVP